MKTPTENPSIIVEVTVNESGILSLTGQHTARLETSWDWYMLYGHPYTVAILAA